jgi:hypothetical protein
LSLGGELDFLFQKSHLFRQHTGKIAGNLQGTARRPAEYWESVLHFGSTTIAFSGELPAPVVQSARVALPLEWREANMVIRTLMAGLYHKWWPYFNKKIGPLKKRAGRRWMFAVSGDGCYDWLGCVYSRGSLNN